MDEYDVDEILRTIIPADETNWKPSDKIPLVTKEIEKMKNELKSFLISNHFELASILNEGKELTEESKTLVEEMKACEQEIEEETMAELLRSIESHDSIVKQLESVNFSLDIINDVIQLGKYVKEFHVLSEDRFSKAVEAVSDVLQYIENPSEGVQHLDLFEDTKNRGEMLMDSLINDMFKEWDKMVVHVTKTNSRMKTITMTLTLDKTVATLDLLNAMYNCNKLITKVTEFSQFLLREVLTPIVHHDCLVYSEGEEMMTVTIQQRHNFKPPYQDVIANVRFLFNFLNNRINIRVGKSNETIMTMLGQQISKEFSDVLVQDCFVNTIPNNIIDLQTYGVITAQIEEFQRFLFNVKFFSDEEFSILEYVNNIDILFASRSTQYFLTIARSIMVKDLSQSMSIGVEGIPIKTTKDDCKNKDEVVELALEVLYETIPNSLFYFPRCMISKSAQELLDLVYVVMEQAVQCSDVVCKKLYNTARLVFELYDAVVPYHHENYLQTIPQYVALFHNNCMYLAHNLQTFGDKWLTLMEGRELDYPISFIDLVPKLRELGCRHLAIHMQQQRKQVLDNIRSSDLNCIVVKDVLGENAEAAIRQCLRQLHLLKNVWIGVFPSNVFIRLMSTLVNMFIDELIHRVCTVEDISMEMATQLTEMYSLVIQKIPQLYPDVSDVAKYVKPWMKLQELVFVLGGSLKDIELHWDDGTGPLAKHFTTEELRSLIKALFQNTQFRANLLSKIK